MSDESRPVEYVRFGDLMNYERAPALSPAEYEQVQRFGLHEPELTTWQVLAAILLGTDRRVVLLAPSMVMGRVWLDRIATALPRFLPDADVEVVYRRALGSERLIIGSGAQVKFVPLRMAGVTLRGLDQHTLFVWPAHVDLAARVSGMALAAAREGVHVSGGTAIWLDFDGIR